ncbi:MAG: P-II family nitrogen regulator [Prosthecochloris sp.]|uniref:Nitrogen regulatory protein P-II n=1 Tax=Prosthecochloris aestuarii (strain DSM 271 / SK 413) TaxID=290512 RepID=B4S9H7_PROA2|nr:MULTISPECIES: P-II family nitrogen regulator [Prosthecochloris]ACF46647.1 nitrogen regulatory protein P-II [Prosthecochloris aestuarii DSM 271]MCW8797460.1 P-II family nitrogen regulator [Prosthecochloris sp.]NEX12021.1 P-II family nitrogen regulator [Prosthecochloris sp.]
MKEIIAVIRIKKMNETKQALIDAGISSFTSLGRVQGRGKGQVHFDILQGAEEGHPEAIEQLGNAPRLVAKRLVAIVVPDDMAQTAIDTIIRTNQTGKPGDGKIFVTPITDTVRVRTGETGDLALV